MAGAEAEAARSRKAARRKRISARSPAKQEWIKSSPRARQAKSKARYERYEELLKKAGEKQTQTAQIVIPVAERLGQNVVDFESLKKGFGDNLLIDDLTFKLPPGGIVGIIGPNGAGKTTLFRMITGQDKPDQGTIKVGESVQLGYVDQSRDSLDGKKSVWEEISGGLDQIQLGKREVNSRAYCSAFNFKGADQQKKVGQLSGGERNRVHLAKMLKSGANVLLLDEPTNDLDVDTLRALEEALEDFAGCAVIISHDRWFLDRIATHILAFEGDSHVEWFEGNFQDYEKDKMRRLGTDSIIPQRIKYKKVLALSAVCLESAASKGLTRHISIHVSGYGIVWVERIALGWRLIGVLRRPRSGRGKGAEHWRQRRVKRGRARPKRRADGKLQEGRARQRRRQGHDGIAVPTLSTAFVKGSARLKAVAAGERGRRQESRSDARNRLKTANRGKARHG